MRPPPSGHAEFAGIKTIHTAHTGRALEAAPGGGEETDVPKVQPCAGAIVFDDARRVLLVKRKWPPNAGSWSVPGGRCLVGETPDQACIREVAEETGLQVRIQRRAGSVEREGGPGVIYAIDDFVCEVIGGALVAGDDAADARWVTRAGLDELLLVPELFDALADWGLLPD
jgi:8-oxo-dGTP diphosphatase